MKKVRSTFSCDQVQDAYACAGGIEGVASALNVSYGTAQALAHDCGVSLKRQGYTAPETPIKGALCRHAREYLGMTRDQFCELAGIGKTALRKFELGQSTPRGSTAEKIMKTFTNLNIIFDDEGTFVHLQKGRTRRP